MKLPAGVREEVERRYAEPHRAYHGLGHLKDVLRRFEDVKEWQHPREVYAALLFHDAVYAPGAKDNEARSAALAEQLLGGTELDLGYVKRLIELTARHGSLKPSDVSPEEALFLDCDLAILGASAEEFDAYDRGIAREYAALPPEVYSAGRRQFLERLLRSQRIFLSDRFHHRLDAAARANLSRALGA